DPNAVAAGPTSHGGHPVRLEPGAGHDPARQRLVVGSPDDDPVRPLLEPEHLTAGEHRTAGAFDVLGERERDPPEVDDPRRRRPEAAQARGMRLDLPDPLRAHPLEPRDSVRGRPLTEGVELAELALLDRDDELADPLDRDPPPLAVRLEVG